MQVQKKDLLYSWGLPILGLPLSGFFLIFGWLMINATSTGIFLFGMFFFITGIIGLGATILMFVDVKKGIISQMFIKNHENKNT